MSGLERIQAHQKAFDLLYSETCKGNRSIGFPLKEIDKFRWDRGPFGDHIYSYFYKRFTVFMLGLLQVEASQRILNIGCGFGFDEKNLAHLHPNLDIWSIDISQEMILKAIENQCPSRLCLSLAEALPFPDDSFDRIIAREVIEHVHSPETMLKEIARCLKPGGLAVVTTEFESSLALTHFYSKFFYQKWAKVLRVKLPEAHYQNKPPSLEDVKAWVKSSGLLLEKAIWDGALYQLCTSLLFQKIFKSKVVTVAHFFSSLENSGGLERFFCDQVKFAFRKPSSNKRSRPTMKGMDYCCPLCHGIFEDLRDGKQCSFCRKIYPYINDGILNFIAYDFKSSEKTEKFRQELREEEMEERAFSQKIKKILFRSLHFLGYWIYLFSVLFAAIILVYYRKHFAKSGESSRSILDEKLAGYLQIGGQGVQKRRSGFTV